MTTLQVSFPYRYTSWYVALSYHLLDTVWCIQCILHFGMLPLLPPWDKCCVLFAATFGLSWCNVLDKRWRDEHPSAVTSFDSKLIVIGIDWSTCGLFNSERKLIKLSQLSVWICPKTLPHSTFVTVSWGSQLRLRRLQSSLVLACLRHAESSTFHVHVQSIIVYYVFKAVQPHSLFF